MTLAVLHLMLATLAFAAQLLTLAPQYATVGRPRTLPLPLPLPLTLTLALALQCATCGRPRTLTPTLPLPFLNPTPNANPPYP